MLHKSKSIVLLGGDNRTKILYQTLLQNDVSDSLVLLNQKSKKHIKKTIRMASLVVGTFKKQEWNMFINQICLKYSISWLPFCLYEKWGLLDIGPFVKNRETSCFACYVQRIKENKVNSFASRQRNNIDKHTKKELDYLLSIYVTQTVKQYISSHVKITPHTNTIATINLLYRKKSINLLLQNPLCSYCKAGNVSKKVVIRSKKVKYRENGLRIDSAKTTWENVQRYIHHAGLISGLICREKPFHNLNIYQSISADPLDNSRFCTHAGKGNTIIQNKTSAALEGIERYCSKLAMLNPFNSEIVGSYHMMKKSAIHPSQFQMHIPGYNDQKKIRWIKAWSITHKRLCLLPLYFVSLIPIGSNGLASGNCIEEAVFHGILELIERDIYMIMDLQELNMPDLDISSIKDKKVLRLLHILNNQKTFFHIKYIRNDTNIPTFSIYIQGAEKGKKGYAHAVCSHLDKNIALSRTVTEAIQQYPKFQTGTRWLQKNIQHYFQKSDRRVLLQDIYSYTNSDLKQNIHQCLLALSQLGLETFVVNHSLPGLEFSVVRVLIAGLQPIWFSQSNHLVGRVFSVPKKLGFQVKSKKHLNFGLYSGFPYFAK